MKNILLSAIALLMNMTVDSLAQNQILGWGSYAPRIIPSNNVAFVTAGREHYVAVLNDGTAVGVANTGITDNRAQAVTRADLTALGASRITHASAGGSHTLYVLDNNYVLTRGSNANSQISNFALTGVTEIIGVATGNSYCAVAYRTTTSRYQIMFWGRYLGITISPRRVLTSTDLSASNKAWNDTRPILAIAGGNDHLAWIASNSGTRYVTGIGTFGALPLSTSTADVGADQISAGSGYTLFLKSNNLYGQGSNTSPGTIMESNVAEISAGVGHYLVKTTTGTVIARTLTSTGSQYGQHLVPTELGSVSRVEAGDFMSFVVMPTPPTVSSIMRISPGLLRLRWPVQTGEYRIVRTATDPGGPYTTVFGTVFQQGNEYYSDVPDWGWGRQFFKIQSIYSSY